MYGLNFASKGFEPVRGILCDIDVVLLSLPRPCHRHSHRIVGGFGCCEDIRRGRDLDESYGDSL